MPSGRWLAAFAVLVGGLLVGSIFWLPGYLVERDLGSRSTAELKPPELLKAKNDVRGTLIQALGGGLFLATAFFTWRQIRIGQEQLRVSEQEQLSSRFTKAIEQLGHEKADVRLGGIYALERIARDSPRDHGPIIEVLTAFLRGSATWDAKNATRDKDPATDVQAALTVIARRNRASDVERLDLSHLDLRRAHLDGAGFDNALLNEAHLDGAHLHGALLGGVRFVKAQLGGADLGGAKLAAARFVDANLVRAVLIGADLTGAEFTGADLTGARLMRTRLEGADLRSATIDDTTRLRGASWDATTRWPANFDPDAHVSRPS
jgi:uncharacterized protein YjbI with pentapeptide repeats